MKKVLSIIIILVLLLSSLRFSITASTSNFPSGDDAAQDTSFAKTTYDTTLMAYQTENLEYPAAQYNPRAGYFTSVGNTVLTYRGTTARKVNYQQLTKAQLIYELQSATILFIHTHGAAGVLQISPSSPYYLYTTDLSSTSLSNLKCAVLLACKCGMTVPSSTNMVQTMVNRGAKCVVGFSNDVTLIDCNLFAQRFAVNTMQHGMTVYNAIHNMNVSDMTNNMISLSVIGGNSATTLN